VNTTLWIIAGIAAAAFAAGGATLLLLPKENYRALGANQHWVDDLSNGHLKAIGTIKLIGAIGLILPAAVGVAPLLVPIAACGLMLFMAGAATTRFRRGEWGYMAGDIVFIAVFAFLAWGRLAQQPFA
jgi:VIT1/CCC1 family predicted Fe2+/Mn2+ transporter